MIVLVRMIVMNVIMKMVLVVTLHPQLVTSFASTIAYSALEVIV